MLSITTGLSAILTFLSSRENTCIAAETGAAAKIGRDFRENTAEMLPSAQNSRVSEEYAAETCLAGRNRLKILKYMAETYI